MHDDIEALRVPSAQLGLLQPYRVLHVLQRHGQSVSVAENLHYRGLLSFDPNAVLWLTPAQEAELDFLCGITKVVGLRGVDGMLTSLTAPYAFPLHAVVFDFSAGAWRRRADVHADRIAC